MSNEIRRGLTTEAVPCRLYSMEINSTSKVWPRVQDILDSEMNKRKLSQLAQMPILKIRLLDEYVQIYSHTPPSTGKLSLFKGENLGCFYVTRSNLSTADYLKDILNLYHEAYPNFRKFRRMYNAACFEDYIRKYGHLPNTSKKVMYYGVNISHLYMNARAETSHISEGYRSLLNDVMESAPLYSERTKDRTIDN